MGTYTIQVKVNCQPLHILDFDERKSQITVDQFFLLMYEDSIAIRPGHLGGQDFFFHFIYPHPVITPTEPNPNLNFIPYRNPNPNSLVTITCHR